MRTKHSKHNTHKLLYAIYIATVTLPFICMAGIYIWYHNQLDKIRNAQFIVVSKQDMRLRVFDYAGEKKAEYGIACGKNYGQKEKVGDMKTPEGIFHIVDVEDASNRTHDFGDGKGPIEGAYGPYFIRLDTPGCKGIGIHGTHDPNSIGTRATEGCIRLKNEDVSNLAEHVFPGEVVIVTSSLRDFEEAQSEAEKKNGIWNIR